MIEDFRSADSARLDPAAEVLKGQWNEHRLARNVSDDAGMPDAIMAAVVEIGYRTELNNPYHTVEE